MLGARGAASAGGSGGGHCAVLLLNTNAAGESEAGFC